MIKTKTSGLKNSFTFIMGHGAGAPMDSDWMNCLTKKLVSRDIKVIRFEFPYMQERRKNGAKRPPNTTKILIQTWKDIIEQETKKNNHLFIGGKSMGGRIASLVADEMQVKGLIALGFPFHAPGKDPGMRIAHLKSINTPTLIIQGTRDPMGSQSDCKNYLLSKNIQLHWLRDGDHSWKPRKKSGLDIDQHMENAAGLIEHFIKAS